LKIVSPKFVKYCPILGTEGKKFPVVVDDVIGHVTIWLPVGDFLWVVHCDHASILHHYWDIAIWSSSRKALPRTKVGWLVVGQLSILHLLHILHSATLGT